MSQPKQILVIDDLLTPQQNFETSVKKVNLDYDVVWDEKAASPAKVEVIVTVLKKLDKEKISSLR